MAGQTVSDSEDVRRQEKTTAETHITSFLFYRNLNVPAFCLWWSHKSISDVPACCIFVFVPVLYKKSHVYMYLLS